jgi:hypothetical protein
MLVVDPWHWLTEDGEFVVDNPRLYRRMLRIARFIEYGGPLKEDETRETLVECPPSAPEDPPPFGRTHRRALFERPGRRIGQRSAFEVRSAPWAGLVRQSARGDVAGSPRRDQRDCARRRAETEQRP